MPCRRRCCGASSRVSTAGTTNVGVSVPSCASGWRASAGLRDPAWPRRGGRLGWVSWRAARPGRPAVPGGRPRPPSVRGALCSTATRCAQHLAERGVATGIHYPVPIHRTAAYADLGLGPGSLPVSEALAERICSLPIFPGMHKTEIEQIIGAQSQASQKTALCRCVDRADAALPRQNRAQAPAPRRAGPRRERCRTKPATAAGHRRGRAACCWRSRRCSR